MQSALGRFERSVLDELLDWRRDFIAGELRPLGIRQPQFEPGERFAVKIVGIAASGSGEPLLRGAAHATDRRVFIVQNRPQPVREWRWHELDSVRLMTGWKGILLGPEPSDVIATVHSPKRGTAVGWLKLQGAHACAADRLDEWFEQLPDLLGAGG